MISLINQRALEGDSPMPKKATDKQFQIQNNLVPQLQCFVIDRNRFKQRSKLAKTVIETATETIGNGIKGSLLESVHINEAYVCLFVFVYVVCAPDDMPSGFNTTRKAAWLNMFSL